MTTDLLHVKMLLVIAMILSWNGFSRADEIFFDDFSDGSVTNDVPVAADGTPVRWSALPVTPNTIADASSGDLALSADMPVGVPGAAVMAEQFTLSDVSIRTQLSRDGNDVESNGVIVRESAGRGYGGGIGPLGGIWILRDTTDFIALEPNAVNPEEEWNLQLDAIGNKLQLWVWAPGSPMPLQPQLTAFDDTYTDGNVGLFTAFRDMGNQGSSGTSIFRYVQVADMVIPEPATSLLCTFGLMCLAVVRRKQ